MVSKFCWSSKTKGSVKGGGGEVGATVDDQAKGRVPVAVVAASEEESPWPGTGDEGS